jgi:endonuclease/exonuclease/phosphatase family metal-dependent hydrolase
MRKLTYNFLFVMLSLFAFTTNLQATTLRIATYNIWNPIFEEKNSGKNTWKQRLPFIIENIVSSKSDVICLEEVGKNAYLDVIQNSEIDSQYMSFYISHAPSKEGQKEGRDGIAFFYKPEKVILRKLVQSSNDSRPTHRRDFYVDLKLNEQREVPVQFRIACTHLDSEKDLTIGNTQLAALVEDVLKLDNEKELDFVIVCGDFNEGEDESLRPRYEIMYNAGFITDGTVESTRPEALDVRHKGHVDWIYLKKLSELSFDLIPLVPVGDEKGSDHKLTMTDVEIK